MEPLSLELITDQLKFGLEQPLSENPSFSTVELYVLGSSDHSGRSLLISTLSEALLVPKQKGLHFLCVRDRSRDDAETDYSLQGIHVVNRNIELKELFNCVQRIFYRIQNWVSDMQKSVMEDRGVQDLMTLSEPIIGNHIALMDSAFKLLACTKNIEIDDEVTNRLMEYGYHPEETVAQLRNNRRIEQYETAYTNGLIVSDDHLISNYTTVKKVYRFENTYFAIVVMNCCGMPNGPALLELFQMLLQNIGHYVERANPIIGGKTSLESLIGELIEQRITSEREVKDRAATIGIPFEGSFTLDLLEPNDVTNTPRSRIVTDLSALLSGSRVMIYDRKILILSNSADGTDAASRAQIIKETYGSQITCCGTSNMFSSLWDLPAAYEQAIAAIEAGERLRKAKIAKVTDTFYRFEDYYLYHMLSNSLRTQQDVFRNSFAVNAIRQLKEYDEKHKTRILEILYTYLSNDRNATETCAIIHMHRNTILYHISKVETILGVSLEDEDVRLKILLGYRVYQMGRI